MPARKVLGNLLIAFYLYVSLSALWFTMTHTVLLPPRIITLWSYAMMGPYQGYDTQNQQLRAEGLGPDGTWRRIELRPYIPMHFGEFIVRGWLRGIRRQWGDEASVEGFRAFAAELQRLESARGRPYAAVRLFWDRWPRSPEGFEVLRLPLFTTSEPVGQYP